jgi:hypothetical protein
MALGGVIGSRFFAAPAGWTASLTREGLIHPLQIFKQVKDPRKNN